VRYPQLRAAARRIWGFKCYCCGFDFEAFHGDVAKGVAIVHHLRQFQESDGKPRKATVKDARVVCANCHQVIHLEKEPIHVDDLKKRISESWTVWSEKGVRRKKEG
jgi:predicted HNH restriction endonuclease